MPTVLIVDDEPAVIQMIGCVLEIRGYQVVGAGNGTEALRKMEETPPNLIITDLVMPGMNGLDFCRKVKQDDRWKCIPVMIVTSATRGTDLADGFWKLGTEAADFVTKPFDPFEMADRVERLLKDNTTEISEEVDS